jgi:hypothetical protein
MQIVTVSFSQRVSLAVKHTQAQISVPYMVGFLTVNFIARRDSNPWETARIREIPYRWAGVVAVGVKTQIHLRTITGRANPRLQTQTGVARAEALTDSVAGAAGKTGSMARIHAVTGVRNLLI